MAVAGTPQTRGLPGYLEPITNDDDDDDDDDDDLSFSKVSRAASRAPYSAYLVVIITCVHYLGPPGSFTSQILGTFSRFRSLQKHLPSRG